MNGIQKESNFLSAVVYLHNDQRSAEPLLRALHGLLCENFKHFEILCLDDASTDETPRCVRELARELPGAALTLVSMSGAQGVEAAMKAGVDLSIGDFVLELDSTARDYPMEMVMDVYRRALCGFDVVAAAPTGSLRRSSSLFYRLFNRFSGIDEPLKTERFRILSRRVVNRVTDMNAQIPYRKVAYALSGLAHDTLYYPSSGDQRITDREENRLRKSLAIDTLVMFTDVAFRIGAWLSLMMMALALFMGVYALVIFFSLGAVAGWTTTILFLSVAFFGVFFILTVLVKYLSIIVKLLVHRKEYTVANVEKLSGGD
ncbi:MAG: glycosyltransferase [Clostridia bacterium]|nr:glycosyltransferase [Clostridia bacterium]